MITLWMLLGLIACALMSPRRCKQIVRQRTRDLLKHLNS